MDEFFACFSELEDPRDDNARHDLHELLLIALCAMLCGAEDCSDMALFGRSKEAFLREFLGLRHGIPSHDTFSRVFRLLDPVKFHACFLGFMRRFSETIQGVIAIDGKTLRRSFDRASQKSALHLVTAWAADQRLVLGQMAVDGKSNEITAVPKLLELLSLRGAIITADALHCQRAIAGQIVDQGGDYVLALKGNQQALPYRSRFLEFSNVALGLSCKRTHYAFLRGTMQIHKLFTIAVALALQTLLLQAETATRSVGNAQFNFAVPRQFCVLEDTNSRDALFINVVRTLLRGASNKLILLTVNCDRLKTWREGVSGNILRYAMYYLPDNLENSSFPGDTKKLRQDLCVDMRKQGDATLAGVKDIVSKAAKELNANIAVTGTKYVGVVDEDEHGCYAALLINVKGGDGKAIVMSSIVTSTVVHGKPMFFAIYNQYSGPDTAAEDIDRSKIVAAEFDRANP